LWCYVEPGKIGNGVGYAAAAYNYGNATFVIPTTASGEYKIKAVVTTEEVTNDYVLLWKGSPTDAEKTELKEHIPNTETYFINKVYQEKLEKYNKSKDYVFDNDGIVSGGWDKAADGTYDGLFPAAKADWEDTSIDTIADAANGSEIEYVNRTGISLVKWTWTLEKK